MRRGKDFKFNFHRKVAKKGFIFYFILSFSLHLIIIFLIAIFIKQNNESLNLLKDDRKINYQSINIILSQNTGIINEKIEQKVIKNLNATKENKILNKEKKINEKTNEKTEDSISKLNLSQKEEKKEEALNTNISQSINQDIENEQNNTNNFDSSDINIANGVNSDINSQGNSTTNSDLNSINSSIGSNIFSYSINYKNLFKYPKDALKLKMQGIVRLNIAIDSTGKVIDVILLESSGFKLLDNYTIKQASLLLFTFPKDQKTNFPLWIIIKVIYSIKSNVTVTSG